jgi:hypothetical protein
MPTFSRPILVALFTLTTSSCDVFYGIQRTVEIERLLSPEDVIAALEEVPGMDGVERHTMPASTSWRWFECLVHDPPYEQYAYTAGELSGVVVLREVESGERTLGIYRTWINIPPTLAVYEDTRRLMDLVYMSLRQRIPDLPTADQVKEKLNSPPRR